MAFLKQFVTQHPRLTAWFVLAVGFVIILVVSARSLIFASPEEGGFSLGQTAALIVTTVGLAGLCVWIIGWEDEEEDEQEQKQE